MNLKKYTHASCWYCTIKAIIGLIIILGLYVAAPLWSGFIFLNRPGSSVENSPVVVKLFFGYFTILSQYALPLPVGVFVWVATLIGLGFIVFRKKYWKTLDALAIITLLLLALLVSLLFKNSGQQNQNRPLGEERAVLCDQKKWSCGRYEKVEGVGDLKAIITADGEPVRRLEVDVADRPGAAQYYLKLTDEAGMALFNNLPAGSYKIYFNLNTLPGEYEGSAGTTIGVEVIAGKTTEQKIELK